MDADLPGDAWRDGAAAADPALLGTGGEDPAGPPVDREGIAAEPASTEGLSELAAKQQAIIEAKAGTPPDSDARAALNAQEAETQMRLQIDAPRFSGSKAAESEVLEKEGQVQARAVSNLVNDSDPDAVDFDTLRQFREEHSDVLDLEPVVDPRDGAVDPADGEPVAQTMSTDERLGEGAGLVGPTDDGRVAPPPDPDPPGSGYTDPLPGDDPLDETGPYADAGDIDLDPDSGTIDLPTGDVGTDRIPLEDLDLLA